MTESERDRMQLELASKPAFTPQRSGIKRSKQDVEGAKEVPLAVLRGRLAGLLGLPSDVGNIVRSPMPMEAFGDVDYSKPEQLPYGTEQFLQELPLAPKSAVGKLAGNVASLVPLNPAPAARAAGRVGKEVLREVAKGMEGKGALGKVIPQAVRPMYAVDPTPVKGGIKEAKAKPASPYLQETLPDAEAEANLAAYLDPSKEQGRWYTGTSSDIHEFNPALGLEKPGQAGATFVTQNPDFAASFAKDAHLTNPHPERYLTPEKIELAKENAKQYFRDTYTDMPEHADEMIKSIQAGKPVGEAEDALQGAYRELMPAGPNIMPVYVRTTNPFDFANPEHIASLKAIYPDLPALNRTSAIEIPEVQDAIKAAGFDAFYTAEGGNRNLGLFQPTQLKSAIGNVGTYDVTNPLISKKDGGLVTMPSMSDSGGFFTDPDFARFAMEQPR